MRTRTRTILLRIAVFIFVLLSVLFGPIPTGGQPLASFYHLSTFTATVQEDTWDLSRGDPDLSIIIKLSIRPENSRQGYRARLFLLSTFPDTFTATWELPYPVRIPGKLMPFVDHPEFILAQGDLAFVYLMDMEDSERGGGVIAEWILSQDSFTLPLTFTAPNGATLTITGIQEPIAKPWQRICPSCGALVTTCYRPDPSEPIQEWYCSRCGHVIYEG